MGVAGAWHPPTAVSALGLALGVPLELLTEAVLGCVARRVTGAFRGLFLTPEPAEGGGDGRSLALPLPCGPNGLGSRL